MLSSSLPTLADPPLAWARYYISCGLSVIPILPGTKKPGFAFHLIAWKRYTREPADDAQLVQWFGGQTADQVGIGVVMGKVSGNVVALDVDHVGFCEALRQVPQFLRRTWVQESGSGKLHIIVRGAEDWSSSAIKSPLDHKLVMDIKGENGYILAAPSRFMRPDGVLGTYKVLFGSPENIAAVPDPRALGWRLYRSWSGTSASMPEGKMSIAEPADDVERERLDDKIRDTLNGKAQHGVWQDHNWELHYPQTRNTGESWNSEVHFVIIQYLVAAMWDNEDIRLLMATYPCGNLVYRREDRPHHGDSMLWADVDKARKYQQSGTEAAADASGVNFEVLSIRKIDYGDELTYDIEAYTAVREQTRRFTARAQDIFGQATFLRLVSSHLDILAELPPQLAGKSYKNFLAKLMHMVETDPVPDEIRVLGYIRGQVCTILGRGNAVVELPAGPTAAKDFRIGWSANGMIHMRGGTLVYEVGMMSRTPTAPHRIWEALREVGAEQDDQRYTDNTHERLWVIPRQALFPY